MAALWGARYGIWPPSLVEVAGTLDADDALRYRDQFDIKQSEDTFYELSSYRWK